MASHPQFDPSDEAFLAELTDKLAAARANDEARKRAFTNQVMARIEADPTPSWRRRLFSGPKLLFAAVMVVLVLGILLVQHFGSDHAIRAQAEKIPVPKHGIVARSDLFAAVEGKRIVMVVYEYYGEHCLWLFDEEDIRPSSDPEVAAEWEQREKWYAQVNAGRLKIPARALAATSATAEDWVIIQVRDHFEIWSAAALDRYLREQS